jgi:hypothetical protein
MLSQCACLTWIFAAMSWLRDLEWAATTSTVLVLAVVAITLASGLDYLLHARRVLGADQLAALTHRPAPQRASGGGA